MMVTSVVVNVKKISKNINFHSEGFFFFTFSYKAFELMYFKLFLITNKIFKCYKSEEIWYDSQEDKYL